MKIAIILAFLIHISPLSDAQTIGSIFISLPKDCIPDLNISQKKFLLKNKEYILPGGDSLETIKYTIAVDEKNQYLSCKMNFTTGQNGFSIIQIRKFIKKDGGSLIVFSRYGGLLHSYFQDEIRCFNSRNNKLTEIKNKPLPDSIGINRFFKSNTPDSLRVKLGSYISTSNDLRPELENAIAFKIFSQVNDGEAEKYIIGNSMHFIWTGLKFRESKIKNSD